MAKMFVSEYVRQLKDNRGQTVPVGEEPALATQVVDFTAGVQSFAAFNAKTTFVRVHTDAICSYKFAQGGVVNATVNDARMAAGQTEYFAVVPGTRLSVIVNT